MTTKFDLALTCMETGDEIACTCKYCTRLFKGETIERFFSYFKKILSFVVKRPEVRLSQIEIIPGKEKRRILLEFNNTAKEYPKDKTIYQLFEEQVERTPDKIAVVDRKRSFDYSRIAERVVSLVRFFQAEGIESKVRISVLEVNSHAFSEICYAAAGIGAILNPLSHRLTPKKIAHILRGKLEHSIIS